VSGITPDEWATQRSEPWGRIERIQGAFRKGRKDEAEEQYQRDWEAKQRKEQLQATNREAQERIEKLKAG
jgi:hypothetical protein